MNENMQYENLIRIQRDLAFTLSGKITLEECLRLSLQAVLDASEMDCGGIYFIIPASGALTLVCHKGLSPEFAMSVSRYGADSPNTKLVMAGSPVYTKHELLDVILDNTEKKEQLRAIGVIPLWNQGRVYGCLNAASHTKDEIPVGSRQAIETLCMLIGSVISRIKAEDEIRMSEEKFKKVFAISPDAICITRFSDGIYVSVNKGFSDMTGYTEEEVIGKTSLEINIWKDPADRMRFIDALESRGELKNFEVSFISKKGVRCGLMFAFIIELDGVPHIVDITRDITEQKNAENMLHNFNAQLEKQIKERTREIAAANTRLEHLLTSSAAVIYTNEASGAMGSTYISENARDVLGYHPGDWIGNPGFWTAKIHPDDRDRYEADIGLLLKQGRLCHEYRFRHKDGMYRWLRDEKRLIRDDSGAPMEIAGHIVDITAIKQIERELLQTLDAANNANLAKSDFLANMSHELRTPLNSIIGFTEVLFDGLYGELTEKQKGYLSIIEKKSWQLLNLINDILDLSKVESGKMELEIDNVSIKEVINGSLNMVKEKAMKHGLSLSAHIEQDADIILSADERKIKQIIFNLLSNAVKFTADGGAVRVNVRRISNNEKTNSHIQDPLPGVLDAIEISVEDSGIGITPEDMSRLFSRFGQIESSYEKKYNGTGLGLALSKVFVEMHGGHIWAESEPGKGTRLIFTIPVSAPFMKRDRDV